VARRGDQPAGTAFGFWYYSGQFAGTAAVLWPWVPDSPLATLFIALAIACWKLGREQPWLTALAFFGNIVLGLWTPYTLLAFADSLRVPLPGDVPVLFWSHLAMVVQAFVLYRISDFPVWGRRRRRLVLEQLARRLLVPIVGEPHHTIIPVERDAAMFLEADALGVIAAGEVTFVLLALFLALAIRVKKFEAARSRP